MARPSIGAQASRLARDLPLGISSTPSTRIPRLVYGTAWKKDQTADLVYLALKTGFRGIDTAAQPKHYDERGVGTGVRRAVGEGIIKREDLFVRLTMSLVLHMGLLLAKPHISRFKPNLPHRRDRVTLRRTT